MEAEHGVQLASRTVHQRLFKAGLCGRWKQSMECSWHQELFTSVSLRRVCVADGSRAWSAASIKNCSPASR